MIRRWLYNVASAALLAAMIYGCLWEAANQLPPAPGEPIAASAPGQR